MPAIAITGGIASGKSAFTASFLGNLPGAQSFDTDAAARRLLAEDPGVAAEVRAFFGEEVFGGDGRIDRTRVRARVFAAGDDPAPRRALEAILHPRVRAAWRQWLDAGLQNDPAAVMVVEIPLLYETGAAELFDHVIVVGCSRATQQRRLTGDRRLDAATADRIIASQWPLADKVARCDHLVWNDGSEQCLRAQATRCARYFQLLLT